MPKLEQAELFAATTIIGASVAIWGTVPVLVAYLLWDTFFSLNAFLPYYVHERRRREEQQ